MAGINVCSYGTRLWSSYRNSQKGCVPPKNNVLAGNWRFERRPFVGVKRKSQIKTKRGFYL